MHFNDLCKDVALEIFLHVVEEDGVTMRMNQGPWLLGHVCSSWRQFVNVSPSLWSIIKVTFTDIYRREIEGVSALLNTALSRSLNFPLHISFKSSFICDEQSLVALDALLIHSPRWQTADLTLSADMLYEVAGSGPTFTLLSHLRFVLWISDDWTIKWLPVLLFQDTPMLHTVVLDGIQADQVHLNWGQLRTLTNIGEGDSELRVLQSTPNLKSYSAEYSFHSRLLPPVSGTAVVRLPHLQDISLWGFAIGDMELVEFELPNLQNARIDVGDDPAVVSLDCVLQLIAPKCALRSLSLNGFVFAFGDQLMEILEQLDGTLEVLSLGHRVIRWEKSPSSSSRTFIGAFVAALTTKPKKKCLLPRLRDLQFDIRSSNVELDMEWGPIGRMWVSRQQVEYGDQYPLGVVRLEEMYFADRQSWMRNGVLTVTPVQEGVGMTGDFDGLDVGDLYATAH